MKMNILLLLLKTYFDAVLWVRWQESTWRHLHEGYLACKTSPAAINYQIYQMPPIQLLTVARQGLKFLLNKTAELSQRRPRDAPNIWVPWKVLRVLTTHPATSPEICNGLLLRSILRMCVQNLKFVALPVPEIIGGTQKIGQSLDTPTLHFLPKF